MQRSPAVRVCMVIIQSTKGLFIPEVPGAKCSPFQYVAHVLRVPASIRPTFRSLSVQGMSIPTELKWAIFETLPSWHRSQRTPPTLPASRSPSSWSSCPRRCSASSPWSPAAWLRPCSWTVSRCFSFIEPLISKSFYSWQQSLHKGKKIQTSARGGIFFSFEFAKCFEGNVLKTI